MNAGTSYALVIVQQFIEKGVLLIYRATRSRNFSAQEICNGFGKYFYGTKGANLARIKETNAIKVERNKYGVRVNLQYRAIRSEFVGTKNNFS